MSNKSFNENNLKYEVTHCYLKSVCLWTENDFLNLLKSQENNKDFQKILLSNIYLSKENYYNLLCNFNFNIGKSIHEISWLYSSCDIFNLTINKLLKSINKDDQEYMKYNYLFNPTNIAKRAAAKLIVKKFIETNDLEYIIEFINKENIDMEIIMNILLIEDKRIENFQTYLLQKYLIEKWDENNTKYVKMLLSFSPWLISELATKYKNVFSFLFNNILKELFLIFIKLTTVKEERLRATDLQPIYRTNIYFENLDKKTKTKFEQILNLIKIFNHIEKYQPLIEYHLKDFINTLYQFENTEKSQTNQFISNFNNNSLKKMKKSLLLSKFETVLLS